MSNCANWERLKLEKSAAESAFERELRQLRARQEAELAAAEESLRKCHSAQTEHLKVEHQSEMEELRTQQQEQVTRGAFVYFLDRKKKVKLSSIILEVQQPSFGPSSICDKSLQVLIRCCVPGGGDVGSPPGSHSGAQRHA